MSALFLGRIVLAAVGGLMLLAADVHGALAALAWALVVLAVGSELLASLVFVARRRSTRKG
jgi:hypothetical protein